MSIVGEEDLELFNDSFQRCLCNHDFFKRFYELFLGSSQEVRDKFVGTAFKQQICAVHASLVMTMLASTGNDAAHTYLDKISERHSRLQMDIKPHLYELWLQALISAVRENDPLFSDRVEQSWRQVMSYGINYLVSKY